MQDDQTRQDLQMRQDASVRGGAPAWLTRLLTQAGKLPPDFGLAAVLAGVALLLRLHGLGGKSFWFDEISTWLRARLPLAQLTVDALTHKHFPTYFLLVGPFAATHSPEWMLRLPSALLGAVSVFLVTRLACAACGALAGVVAGLLMALSPVEVQFAQEARPYALISCLVLVALGGLVRIAQNPATAALSIAQPAALRGAWIAYVVGTTGALLVENNTIPWLLASNLAFVVVVLRARSGRGGLIRNWAWSQALIVLCWLPALIFMTAMNRNSMLSALEWIPRTDWQSVRTTLAALYLFRFFDLGLNLMPTPLPGFGLLIALFAVLGAWRLRTKPDLLAVIALAFLAMPMTAVAASAFQSLWLPRYLLWSTGPYFVLAGTGVAALSARFSALAALFVAIGGAASLAPYYQAETKPPWAQAAAYLAANARPRDAVFAENPYQKYVLASYWRILDIDPAFAIVIWDARYDMARRAAAAEHAWIVYGRVGQGAQESEAEFRRKWSALGTPAARIRFGSSILILRFDNAPPGTATEPEGGPTAAEQPH